MTAPAILLMQPQMGENIGATARAMQNFGLSDLRLIAPRDGWPNPKAVAMARNASAIVEAATVYPTLAEATVDCHRIYATSPRDHRLSLPVMDARAAIAQMQQETSQGLKTALLFGPERSGLDNDTIASTHGIIEIPTHPDNHSLNLAQAVVICAYEWWMLAGEKEPAENTTLAPLREHQRLYTHLEEALEESGYFARSPALAPTLKRALKTLLNKGQWSGQEIQTLHGIIRALRRQSGSV